MAEVNKDRDKFKPFNFKLLVGIGTVSTPYSGQFKVDSFACLR